MPGRVSLPNPPFLLLFCGEVTFLVTNLSLLWGEVLRKGCGKESVVFLGSFFWIPFFFFILIFREDHQGGPPREHLCFSVWLPSKLVAIYFASARVICHSSVVNSLLRGDRLLMCLVLDEKSETERGSANRRKSKRLFYFLFCVLFVRLFHMSVGNRDQGW